MQTTFYVCEDIEPTSFLRDRIPELIALQREDMGILNRAERDTMAFSAFQEARGTGINIMSGLPKNDYGQTIGIILDGPVPNISTLTEIVAIPNGMANPEQMTGNCRYAVEERGDIVTEQWFFEYQPGYKPESFYEIAESIWSLRTLSNITHKLIGFLIIFMDNGTYVSLSAQRKPYHKLPFLMGF